MKAVAIAIIAPAILAIFLAVLMLAAQYAEDVNGQIQQFNTGIGILQTIKKAIGQPKQVFIDIRAS